MVYTCKACESENPNQKLFDYYHKKNLRVHYKNVHKQLNDAEVKEMLERSIPHPVTPTPFQCKYCLRYLSRYATLQQHISNLHKKRSNENASTTNDNGARAAKMSRRDVIDNVGILEESKTMQRVFSLDETKENNTGFASTPNNSQNENAVRPFVGELADVRSKFENICSRVTVEMEEMQKKTSY